MLIYGDQALRFLVQNNYQRHKAKNMKPSYSHQARQTYKQNSSPIVQIKYRK
jgi:hypothetical protein